MPTIEKRSLMQSSRRSSIVISLPIWWLRWHGLKAKDKVEVVCGEVLVIHPITKRSETEEEVTKHGQSDDTGQS